MIEKLGGRKFIFCMTALIMTFVLTLMNHVTGMQFTGLIGTLGLLYHGGNVLVHHFQTRAVNNPPTSD